MVCVHFLACTLCRCASVQESKESQCKINLVFLLLSLEDEKSVHCLLFNSSFVSVRYWPIYRSIDAAAPHLPAKRVSSHSGTCSGTNKTNGELYVFSTKFSFIFWLSVRLDTQNILAFLDVCHKKFSSFIVFESPIII
jgi:hypothetical protein